MQTIGVIGLGYVGLPTAIGFHDAGFTVWGVDVSKRTVDMVLQGKNPTGDPDVDDIVPKPGTERWHITTSAAEAVPNCDVVLVTVPTPITHDLQCGPTRYQHNRYAWPRLDGWALRPSH